MPDPNVRNRIHWMIFLGATAAAVALIFFANESFFRDFNSYLPSSVVAPRDERARVTIDFGNSTRRVFAGPVGADMTVLSALRAAGSAGAFEALTDERGRIIDIAGTRNGSGKNWRAYLNQAPIQDLPGHIEIKPGDRIVFQYE